MQNILVVDDDPDIVELLKTRLEANNYEVICALDGKEGIKKAKEQKPDLIIMDILMPNVSGAEAFKILRADAATKHIPIIFLTVLTVGIDVTKVNIDGEFYTSIAKPFKPEKLLSEIEKLIGD